jgi:hypothetical protein
MLLILISCLCGVGSEWFEYKGLGWDGDGDASFDISRRTGWRENGKL